MCNLCIAKRVPPGPVGDKPHVYLHTLVRCQAKKLNDSSKTDSTNDRIAAVESTVADLSEKVKAIEQQVALVTLKLDQQAESVREQFSRLEGYMERMLAR